MAKRRQASSISLNTSSWVCSTQKPAHGYDLHERIAQQLGQIWTISLSQGLQPAPAGWRAGG
ncbi:MAG: hypothetical protein IPK19_10175 [Chloroflexi bacterium]|nr:hypothetical protein [Chloroflexota bacterium]